MPHYGLLFFNYFWFYHFNSSFEMILKKNPITYSEYCALMWYMLSFLFVFFSWSISDFMVHSFSVCVTDSKQVVVIYQMFGRDGKRKEGKRVEARKVKNWDGRKGERNEWRKKKLRNKEENGKWTAALWLWESSQQLSVRNSAEWIVDQSQELVSLISSSLWKPLWITSLSTPEVLLSDKSLPYFCLFNMFLSVAPSGKH